MTKYATQTASALRTLQRKGKLLTFTRLTASIPANIDLATDTETPAPSPTTGSTSGYGVVLAPNTMTQQTYEAQFASGSLSISRVKRVLFSPSGMSFLPQEGDTVTIDGAAWTLLGGKYVNPDDTTPVIGEFTVKS